MTLSREFYKFLSELKPFFSLLAGTLLYFSLAQVGLLFASPPGNVTLVWLPSGVSVAAIAAIGYRAAAGVLLGSFLANAIHLVPAVQGENSLLQSMLIAGFSTAEAAVGAFMLPRNTFSADLPIRARGLTRLLVTALTCSLVAAIPGALVMQEGNVNHVEYARTLLTWWIGDSLGIIIGFPLILTLYRVFFIGRNPAYFLNQILVTAIGLLLSIILYSYSLEVQRETLRIRFSYISDVAFHSLQNAIREILQHQRIIVSQIELEPQLSRARFRALTMDVVTGEFRAQGLLGISWNPLVNREERVEFERQALLQGLNSFQITELDTAKHLVTSSEKDRYFTVLYIEPYEANKPAVGFDIYSDPLRRKAIDIALQRNAPAATAPIELVQESGKLSSNKGALFLWPVRSNSQLIDMEHGIIGFVAAVVNFGNLLSEAGNNLIADASVVITDVTDPGSPVTIYSTVRDPAVAFEHLPYSVQSISQSTEIEALGRRYRVISEPNDTFLTANVNPMPRTLLNISLLLTLVSSLLYFQRLKTSYVREEAHRRLAQIIDSAHDAVITMDDKGLVTAWSAAAREMFGYETQYAIGRRLSDLIIPAEFIVNHDLALRTRSPHAQSRVINNISVMTARKASGELFQVELSVRAVFMQGRHEYVGLVRDISERQRSEATLRESQKLEAIGQLTGGLAHDFNNLLGIVIGNLEELTTGELVSAKGEGIKNALDAALRASMVTKSLMAVARRQNMEIAAFDINAEIAELQPLIETTLGKKIDLKLRLAEGYLVAKIDRSGFGNAIINLIINGRDALSDSKVRCLTIETRVEVVSVATIDLSPGRYVVVIITDTGCGMTPDVLAKVFEPFFTTKQRGLGTGLGLPMVYGFARQLLGTVKIETKEGMGTSVSLYLPMAVGVQQFIKRQGQKLPGSADGDNNAEVLRILVVEDELFLRKLVCRLLTNLGHIVIESESADLAATILDDCAIDILLTDIAMPGKLDGVALANLVTEKYPNTKIILATGFMDQASRSALRLTWKILEKPFRKESLNQILRELSRNRDL